MNPGGADNQILRFRQGGLHGGLALLFRSAINRQGIGPVTGQIRHGAFAVEDKVGRELHQPRAGPRRSPGQRRRRVRIGCPGRERVAFGLVNGGVGGGVDNHVRPQVLNTGADRVHVGDIQRITLWRMHVKLIRRQAQKL